MEEIFQITVDNLPYDIRELNTSPDESQYEVYRNGKAKFSIELQVNDDGNESWVLLNSDTSAEVLKELIDKIGDAIDSYYE